MKNEKRYFNLFRCLVSFDFYMLRPLNTFGGVPSSSIISKTVLLALASFNEATQTSATRSLEISPLFNVFSLLIESAPVGALPLSPPGRTIV